jgi:type I restriction enzyme S subunit
MFKESTIEKTSLPVGWEIKTLGEVSVFSQGIQVGLKKHRFNPKDGYVRFIRIVDYTQNTEDIRYVPNPGEKYFVDEDDIVMVRYGSPGLIGRGKSGVIANNLFRIKINVENLTNDYLSHFLSQHKIQKYLSSQGSATMPALNFGQLKTVDVLFPNSIAQQKQIVATLDKAFAAIDTAKANAEQNLQNAKELFESYLQNVFENKNKGDDWEEKTIDEVTKVLNGHSFKSKDFSSENSVKSIKITNVGVKEFIQTEDNYLPSSFSGTYNKYRVHKGNLVIALTRTIISSGLKVAVVPDEYDNSLLNQRVAALIPKDVINDDYLYHFFCTKIVSDYVLSNVNPLMQPNLSITDLKKLLIPCPSIQEQKKVVQKLNDLTAQTKKLEAIYIQKIADLEEMKKSVLQKAFSGQLNTIN